MILPALDIVELAVANEALDGVAVVVLCIGYEKKKAYGYHAPYQQHDGAVQLVANEGGDLLPRELEGAVADNEEERPVGCSKGST